VSTGDIGADTMCAVRRLPEGMDNRGLPFQARNR
jgi:hypothetical protein